MREHPVPCCICRRDTFHDSAVCDRGACMELMAHAERRIQDRLAARAIRQASSDAATLPSSGVAATSAAVVSSHGTAARGCGISSTGPEPCSPVVAGPVDPFGSGSTRSPSPDERPQVAPLPSL